MRSPAAALARRRADDGAAARERGRGAAGGRGLCTQGLKATYIVRRREQTSIWWSLASLPSMVVRAIHGMETAASFDWGTVTAETFDCVIDWPQGRGSHLAGFSASMQCRPEQEKAKESGRAG